MIEHCCLGVAQSIEGGRSVFRPRLGLPGIDEISLCEGLPPKVGRINTVAHDGLMHPAQLCKRELLAEKAVRDGGVTGLHP